MENLSLLATYTVNSDFSEYSKVFTEVNSRLNLLSKNEIKFLWEKHIYDSLSFKLFYEKYGKENGTILDLGTGGGFPAIPIAIEFPQLEITGLDSINKKILAVREISERLGLENIDFICDRAENIKTKKFDVITSRAVAKIDVLANYAGGLLKQSGYFVVYKSKTVEEELASAKVILAKNGLKFIETIDYTLPLEEIYERRLVIFQKV